MLNRITKLMLSALLLLAGLSIGSAQVFVNEDFSSPVDSASITGWQNYHVPTGTSSPTDLWRTDDPGGRWNANFTGGSFDANFIILDSDHYGFTSEQSAAMESPTFDASAVSNVVLEFSHSFNYSFGETAEVQVSNDGGANWTTVASYTADEGSFTPVDKTIDITAEAAGQPTVAVRFFYQGSFAWWWAIDNVTIQAVCPDPTDLSVAAYGSTTTDVQWTSSASDFVVEYGPQGFSLGSGTQATTTSTNYSIPGLTPLTNYDVYVRAVCSPGDSSSFVGPLTFQTNPTLSPVTLPFTESFSDSTATATSDGILFYGTERIWRLMSDPVDGGEAAFGTDFPAIPHMGTGALALYEGTGSFPVNKAIMEMDMSNYTTATNLFLSFYYMDSGDENHPGDSVWIRGSSSDPWVGVYFIDPQNKTNNTWYYSGIIDIDATLSAAGQTVSSSFQVALGQEDNVGWGSDGIAYDEVTIEEIDCTPPSNLSLEVNGADTAMISWDPSLLATAYDIEYDTAGFSLGSGMQMTGVTDTFDVLTGLMPNTEYDVYVQSDCGSGDTSAWLGPLTFKTYCSGFTAPYSENFDSYTAPVFGIERSVDCWLTAGPGANDVDLVGTSGGIDFGVADPPSLPNAIELNDGNIGFGDTSVFVSPQFTDLPNGGKQITFQTASEGTGTVLYVGLAESLDFSTAVITDTITYSAADVYQQETIYFLDTAVIGDRDHVFFLHDASFDEVYLDDFMYEDAPSCFGPLNFTLDSVSTNTGGVSWDTLAGVPAPSTWIVEYGPTGFSQGSGTFVTGITSRNYVLTGLAQNTQYDVYVTSNCGSNGVSNTVGPITFATDVNLMPVTLPYVEDFESNTGTQVGDGRLFASTQDLWTFTTDDQTFGRVRFGTDFPGTPYLGSGALGMDVTSSGTFVQNNTMLTLDMSNYTSSADLYFSFYYYDQGDEVHNGDSIRIRGDSTNAWIPVDNMADDLDATWNYSGLLDLDSILAANGQSPGATFQIDFGQYDNFVWGSDGIGIDEVSIEEISCFPPSNVAVTNATANSIDLAITGPTGATTWDVEYGPVGFTPGSGTLVTGVGANPSITGLSATTQYDMYVRTDCGGGNGVSSFFGPVSANTVIQLSPVTLPYVEGFESNSGTQTTDDIMFFDQFEIWEMLSNPADGGEIAYGTDYPGVVNSGSGAIALYEGTGITPQVKAILTLDMSNYTASSDLYLSFDFYDNDDETNPGDSVWVRGDSTQSWVPVFDLNETTSTFIWENSGYIDIDSALNAAGQTLGATFQVALGQEDNGTWGGDGFGIDEVMIDEISCLQPSNVAVTNATANSIDLAITGPTGATTWDVEYGPVGFTPGSGTLVTGVGANPSITGLSATTQYDMYVRTDCGGGNGVSSFFGPVSANTVIQLSPVTLPYVEGFESNSGTQTTDDIMFFDQFEIWEMLSNPADGGEIAYGTDYPGVVNSGSGAIALYEGTGITPQVKAILTLDMSNYTASSDLYLSFDFYDNGDETNPGDSVWVRGDSTQSWVPVFDLNETTSTFIWENSGYIDIDSALNAAGQTLGATFQVALGQEDNAPWGGDGFGFDEVSIEEISCFPPANLSAVNVKADSATINWSNPAGNASFELEYGVSGFVPGTGISVLTSNLSDTLSGLMGNTKYDVYARGICGAGDTSTLVGPISFTTLCPPTPVMGDTLKKNICPGGGFFWEGMLYDTTDLYVDTLTSVQGCDSIAYLDLLVEPAYDDTVSATICFGSTYMQGSNSYSMDGVYTDTLMSIGGCDSVVTVNLTVRPQNTNASSASICAGDSLVVGSSVYYTGGTYVDTLTDVNGCDSIETTTVTVLPISTTTLNDTICFGDSYTIGGSTFDSTDTYTVIETAANGCDSIITLNLVERAEIPAPTLSSVSDTLISNGTGLDSLVWYQNGSETARTKSDTLIVSTQGRYTVARVDSNGCMSDTSNGVDFNTGIADKLANVSIDLYPNPNQGRFFINISGIEHESRVEITVHNSVGAEVAHQVVQAAVNGNVKQRIDLADLPSGMYYLRVIGENAHGIKYFTIEE